MSAPTRQPSLRDRLHGIGFSWQSKKAESYSAKPSPAEYSPPSSTKSQSVDGHGYVNPLDLSTVPQAGVLSGDITEPMENSSLSPTNISTTPGQSPEKEEGMACTSPVAEKKTLSRTLTQPQNTAEYTVSALDTLAGIAARFDTTPSELVKLNRLVSRLIFPGQTLYVPNKEGQGDDELDQVQKSPTEKTLSPKPGHVERIHSPLNLSTGKGFFGSHSLGSSNEEPAVSDRSLGHNEEEGFENVCPERFLKINSKHITDGQGFVSGVLLVTPNALMFDPNVSDTLVIEHGVETYGVIAPMDMMIRTAIYFDIAHMRVKDAEDNQRSLANKPKIYSGPGTTLCVSAASIESRDPPTWPVPVSEEPPLSVIKAMHETQDLMSFDELSSPELELGDEKVLNLEEKTVPSSQTPSLEVNCKHPDAQRSDSIEVMISTPPPDLIMEGGLTPTDRPSSSVGGLPTSESDMTMASTLTSEESEEVACIEKLGRSATVREGSRNTQSRRERMLKRLSYPVESLSSYTQKISSNIVDFSSGLFVRSAGTDDCSEPLKSELDEEGKLVLSEPQLAQPPHTQLVNVGYKDMVDGKPDIFAQVDKLLPRPARQYEGQPLYLCLRMGKPINKKVPWSTPIASYSKKRMKKEYWFSIPRARVDELYNFFKHWCPDVYGDVDEVTPEERGFASIDSDQEDEDEDADKANHKELSGESTDVSDGINKTQNRGPMSFLKLVEGHFAADGSSSPFDWELVSMSEAEKSMEVELPLPDLMDVSEILTDDHRKELCKNLPARAEGYPWSLIYSSSKHGFSLKTMYREMTKFETPVLLVITDTLDTVFGAVISCSLKVSDHFYGTGESFLFTFHPDFKCFHWTGENMYFIKGNAESLAIGAGDGLFGIWLDGDLYHGRSHCCKTFGNRDPLSAQEDFVVKALEAWGFV